MMNKGGEIAASSLREKFWNAEANLYRRKESAWASDVAYTGLILESSHL